MSNGVVNAPDERAAEEARAIRPERDDPAKYGVALRCCLTGPEENKGVWVDTHAPNGDFADRAFHLIVHTH